MTESRHVGIFEKLWLDERHFLLRLAAPRAAEAAQPGHFVMVRGLWGHDPLWPRPFSVLDVDERRGVLDLLIRVAGRGTHLLSREEASGEVMLMGPLGRPFRVPGDARDVVLVAGGFGVAPLWFLAKHLLRREHPPRLTLMVGGRSRRDLLLLDRFRDRGVVLRTATEDGSEGFAGVVTELLRERVVRNPPSFVAACGPPGMLRAVDELCVESGVPGQVSMEARMACGWGICLGCAVATGEGYLRVCKDGPIFETGVLRWS